MAGAWKSFEANRGLFEVNAEKAGGGGVCGGKGGAGGKIGKAEGQAQRILPRGVTVVVFV